VVWGYLSDLLNQNEPTMISRVVYQPRYCSVEWIRIAVALRGFLAIAQHFVILELNF